MFEKLTVAVLCLSLTLTVGCSKPEVKPAPQPEQPQASTEPAIKDGLYFAEGAEFDSKTGWKDTVQLEVKDGKLVRAVWNGANVNAGPDKRTASGNGSYPMVEKGGAKAPWLDQATAVEKFLIENQDPKKITYTDDKGHTDAISGATIAVKPFFDLTAQALATGPVKAGPYKDGAYHAEDKDFDDKGWKSTVDLTIINGSIVAAKWNGTPKAGGDLKDKQSREGRYQMDTKLQWYQQAALVEKYLIEKQSAEGIPYKDDQGHTDAVSGATISVSGFFKLASEALASAK